MTGFPSNPNNQLPDVFLLPYNSLHHHLRRQNPEQRWYWRSMGIISGNRKSPSLEAREDWTKKHVSHVQTESNKLCRNSFGLAWLMDRARDAYQAAFARQICQWTLGVNPPSKSPCFAPWILHDLSIILDSNIEALDYPRSWGVMRMLRREARCGERWGWGWGQRP